MPQDFSTGFSQVVRHASSSDYNAGSLGWAAMRRILRTTRDMGTDLALGMAGVRFRPADGVSRRPATLQRLRTVRSGTPVPVTSYRVAGNGCQVPCTSYSWQARRVPYTTYQPTYTAAGCNTCETPVAGYANFAPTLPGAAAGSAGCSTCNSTTVNYGSDWSWTSSGNDGWNTVTTSRPRYASGYDYWNGSPYAAANSAPALPSTVQRSVAGC